MLHTILRVALVAVTVFGPFTVADARPRMQVKRDGILGGRPPGCPHAYCGCSASLYLYGRIIPELNLAANWIRKFPRTYAAPRMVAARRHHVMVLLSHVSGFDWLVFDPNSGNHLTREHVRSIAGYTVLDPRSERVASK